ADPPWEESRAWNQRARSRKAQGQTVTNPVIPASTTGVQTAGGCWVFLDRTHQSLCISILFRNTHVRHADGHSAALQHRHVGRRGILPPLVGMMDLRYASLQGPLPRSDRQLLLQAPAQMPAPDAPSKNIHYH